MATLSDTIDLLGDLVAFPTVSSESNLALIDWAAERLEAAGARVEVLPGREAGKANLFASMGPERAGGIVLSGHTDVVPVEGQPWSTEPFALTQIDDRVFGRGACDMKGFIAACLAVAPEIGAADLIRPVHFAFTFDEETGCFGAQELVALLAEREVRPNLAIVGEPTSMRIIEGHKGCHEYATRFTGLAGHGSAPEKGVNAVEFAVNYATKLLELRDSLASAPIAGGRYDPAYSTVNIGTLKGGVAPNVIPDHAELEWETRPVRAEDFHLVKSTMATYAADVLLPAMRAVHPGADIETEVIGEVAGLEPMAESEARELVAALTGSNATGVVAFGTEAGLFQSIGMSVVVCGPGSIEQAHKADEFVALSELQSCLDMLTKLTASVSR